MQLLTSPLQEVQIPGSTKSIFVKRDDLLHPIASGNKWRKLKYIVKDIKQKGFNELATFGGAFSNHMVATACAGASEGIKTHCFVRGHEPMDSHYLGLAKMHGMNIIQLNREDYKNKEEAFKNYFNAEQVYFINEGGKSDLACMGVAEIIDEIKLGEYTLVHASATGTTAKGILMGIKNSNKTIDLHSIAVLKNKGEQENYLGKTRTKLNFDYTLGGYAKTNKELLDFCKEFTKNTGILIEPIYTGKALFGLIDLIQKGIINLNKPIVFLHTGGMLGVLSRKMLGLMGV